MANLHPYNAVRWARIGKPGTPEWLEHRQRVIGGSVSAAVCNVSKWSDQYEQYCSYRGLLDDGFAGNAYTRFGNQYERIAAADYLHEYGISGCAPKEHMALHPTLDYVGGNPDLLLYPKRDDLPIFPYEYPLDIQWTHGCDVKTTKSSGDPAWGEPDSQKCPIEYWMQCQHYMLVFGCSEWHLWVFFRAECEYRRLIVPRSDKVIEELMLPTYADFWRRVQDGDAPPKAYDKANSLKLIERMAPDAVEGKKIALPDEAGELFRAYAAAAATHDASKKAMDSAKAQLLDLLGDAQRGEVKGAGHLVRSFVPGAEVSYTRKDAWQTRVYPAKNQGEQHGR